MTEKVTREVRKTHWRVVIPFPSETTARLGYAEIVRDKWAAKVEHDEQEVCSGCGAPWRPRFDIRVAPESNKFQRLQILGEICSYCGRDVS